MIQLDEIKAKVEAGVVLARDTSLHHEPFYMMAMVGCGADG